MSVPVPDVTVRRLAPPMPTDGWRSWVAAGVVVTIAAVLRLVRLDQPHGMIFDEIFYATDAHHMLQHGVEWNTSTDSGAFVAHPPLGKWLIATGEKLVGYRELGWRLPSAIAGIVAVLILTRTARRLLRSTVLGCAAGLLMALDGMQLVLSRVALLDIFLLTFVLAAFAALVLDRDQRRGRWLAALRRGADPQRDGRPSCGIPWWRLTAAALTGCALAVKWSALWYLVVFLMLIYLWEAGLRRSAGVTRAWRGTFREETGSAVMFCLVALGVYLACWSGWFATDGGWGRHALAGQGRAEPPVLGALVNFWRYESAVLHFHDHLADPHRYQSWPWQWLLLGRPVPMQWSCAQPCTATSSVTEVLLLGTPALWWAFLPALAGLAWYGIGQRDWRAPAIGLPALAGILPWMPYQLLHRTMFAFYAAPAEPFLILAVVYVLGAWARGRDRLTGALVGGGYVLMVAVTFGYFYPIYVAGTITYTGWLSRMWLGSRWI